MLMNLMFSGVENRRLKEKRILALVGLQDGSLVPRPLPPPNFSDCVAWERGLTDG